MDAHKVLIVDDNPANAKLLSYLLTARGYDVRTAATAGEALVAIEASLPELILMDVQLPGIDGLTLTRQLRAQPRTRDVVIVAVTAYAMQGDEQKAFDSGCDGYVTKPVDTRTFPSLIERFLQDHARQRR